MQLLPTSLVFRNPGNGKAFGVAQGDFDDDGNLDLRQTAMPWPSPFSTPLRTRA